MKYKRVMAIVLASAMMGGSMPVYAAAPNSHVVENTEQAGTVKASEVNPMYRLYNPNSGEHFYTASTGERKHLVSVGWRYEGIGWYAPTTGKPVYRLYNPNAGDHFYTTKNVEKDSLVSFGWKYEGIGWYSETTPGGRVVIYRQYNPNAKTGSHNYTNSKKEIQNLVKLGWRDEGIAWYGINPNKKSGSTASQESESDNSSAVTPIVTPDQDNKTSLSSTDTSSNASTVVPSKTNSTTETSGTSTSNSSTSSSPSADHSASNQKTESKQYTDKDLIGYFGNPKIPEGMTEAEYGQAIVKLHPDIFQPLVDQANRCTTDLGKMIAVSKFIYDQGYTYQVNDDRSWQDCVDFILGRQPYAQCDNVASKTFILCCIVGLPVEKVEDKYHAWNQAQLDGKWYQFDNVEIYHNRTNLPSWQNAVSLTIHNAAYVDVYGKVECGQSNPVEGIYPLANDENVVNDPNMSICIDIANKAVFTYLHGNEVDHTFESLGYRD